MSLERLEQCTKTNTLLPEERQVASWRRSWQAEKRGAGYAELCEKVSAQGAHGAPARERRGVQGPPARPSRPDYALRASSRP